ncbi:MAG: radical SAM protein [Bacteriovoracaceae bacterium]|nr:radical SAM protein [Bacteriovoracaceae bacterium]
MKVSGQYSPEKTICKWRWSYPVITVDRGYVRTCDKTINYQLTEEDFQKYGTDAFLNHPYFLERRREKLFGKRHEDCFNCIILEDKNLMSSRTGKEPFVSWMNDQRSESKGFDYYAKNSDESLLRSDTPDILEISLGNVCNFKCVYCSDDFSTEWEKESVKFGDLRADKTVRKSCSKPASFDKFFWLWFDEIKHSLKRIIFIGGEPLANPTFLQYLEELNLRRPDTKSLHERPIIQVISNFGLPPNKFSKFLDTVEDLTENYIVHLEVSVESFGKPTEYIRHGAKWDILSENVHNTLKRRFKNFRFGFQLAINNLCITSLPELLMWAYELQNEYQTMVDFKENIVVAPNYLSPYILGPEYLEYADKSLLIVRDLLANPNKKGHRDTAFKELSTERWKAYLPFMESIRDGIASEKRDIHAEAEFFDFTSRMEKRRGMKFLEYFPEYRRFYGMSKLSFLLVKKNLGRKLKT